MVDRIRYPTVSYLPFYYVFFQFLLLTIFNLQANILTTKDILSNLGFPGRFGRSEDDLPSEGVVDAVGPGGPAVGRPPPLLDGPLRIQVLPEQLATGNRMAPCVMSWHGFNINLPKARLEIYGNGFVHKRWPCQCRPGLFYCFRCSWSKCSRRLFRIFQTLN